MFKFKGLIRIVNLKAILIAALAVLSTYLSLKFEVLAKFPLTIIATAIIFPVVFSIGGAYKRREQALDHYANLKAHGRAIYFAARDWTEQADKASLQRFREELKTLFEASKTLFKNPQSDMRKNEEAVYKAFSNLSKTIRTELREKGLATGEVSRCNQYLSKMFVSFERIKHIYQYRTPNSLRAFSDFFISILPIVYGPYFAQISQEFSPHLIYVMPILLTFILVSLDNIQDHLENPFDEIGEDDITINTEQFIQRLYD